MKKTALLGLLATVLLTAEQPKFEVADVHASPTARSFAQNFGGVVRGGRYFNRDANMLQLITAAYGVPEEDISDGPGWVSSDIFDIVAKVPEGTTPVTAKLMLQALLADRFGLVVRQDTRPLPRFVLSVGKASKLKSATGDGSGRCQGGQGPQGGGTPGDLASTPNIKVSCRNMTTAAIAENLRQMAGGYLTRAIVDQTKLDGSWDFDLEWTPRAALEAKGSDGISIFDAVDKQLGLKLEPKDVPMPSLSIVKVNRKPTANPDGIRTALALADARFEAATIKPADPNGRPFQGFIYTGGSQIRAGGTLRFFISIALQIAPNVAQDLVLGLPKSADSERWEILAKVPSTGEGAPNIVNGRAQPPPLSVGLEMLRALLVDQFELKTHTETREVTVYALTVGSKHKLTRAAEAERSGCRPDPTAPKPVQNMGTMIGCKNISMPELAENLQRMASAYIDHPIVDATGLEGGWNFLMGWTPRASLPGQQAPNPAAPSSAAAEASVPDGISLFEAVDRLLGLKLVKQKRSIPVIVVDHVREKPVD